MPLRLPFDEAKKNRKLSRKVDGHQFDGSENSSPIIRFPIKKTENHRFRVAINRQRKISIRPGMAEGRSEKKQSGKNYREMKRISEKISLASAKTFNSDLRNVYYSAKKVIFRELSSTFLLCAGREY